jgi:hypothetical protein
MLQSCRVARWHVFVPKSNFGLFIEGLGIENLGIFMAILLL